MSFCVYGAIATGTCIMAAIGAGLTAAGFTQSGIAAGSLAAATQSAIGNVSAGSLFAGLQSLGATGGIIGMLLTGAARMLISFLFVL